MEEAAREYSQAAAKLNENPIPIPDIPQTLKVSGGSDQYHGTLYQEVNGTYKLDGVCQGHPTWVKVVAPPKTYRVDFNDTYWGLLVDMVEVPWVVHFVDAGQQASKAGVKIRDEVTHVDNLAITTENMMEMQDVAVNGGTHTLTFVRQEAKPYCTGKYISHASRAHAPPTIRFRYMSIHSKSNGLWSVDKFNYFLTGDKDTGLPPFGVKCWRTVPLDDEYADFHPTSLTQQRTHKELNPLTELMVTPVAINSGLLACKLKNTACGANVAATWLLH